MKSRRYRAPASRPFGTPAAWAITMNRSSSTRDPGIAAALLPAISRAGLAGHEPALRAVAEAAARRPDDELSNVADAGLCHGAAGLGHLFHRIFRATGSAAARDAAVRWLRRTLEMRVRGEGFGGYTVFDMDERGVSGMLPVPALLTGAAGIALALAHAATDVRPDWDRLMLLSGWP